MHNDGMPTETLNKPVPISGSIRVLVSIFGLASWIAGGISTFVDKSNVGSTTLIVTGTFALMFAASGRWPTKIIVAGNEIDLSEAVQAEGNVELKSESLQDISQRLFEETSAFLQMTQNKSLAETPVGNFETFLRELEQSSGIADVRAYDAAIAGFLSSHFPDAHVISQRSIDAELADFELALPNSASLLIETKYIDPPANRFVGTTLDALISRIPADKRLLVIANVENVELARTKLQKALGSNRADVVCWRGPMDDHELVSAINRFIQKPFGQDSHSF